jgi:hypothetical protein
MSQIEELRAILVGENSEQLSELKSRIESIDARTRDVSEVLAPAINRGIAESDDLINALKAPVSEGLKQAIRAEPIAYADILYPAIAPSIRMAISQAISSLLVTINQTLESATSANGLRNRFESYRTGVPYAELALRRSLLYRVEHVYLIDRDSGLLISECAATGTNALDSDAVSAMFSAIQSFVQDSFSGNDEDRLTDFKVGQHKIWLAHGPKAMLACVIQGEAPESLKTQLYDCLDGIRTRYSQQLENFSGDPSEFSEVDLLMQPLLQLQLKEDEGHGVGADIGSTTLVQKLMIVALLGFLAYVIFNWFEDRSKLTTVERFFASTPGVVLTESYVEDDQVVVKGFMDPDVNLPLSSLEAYGIGRDDIDLQTVPFRSLDPEMEILRFRKELVVPEGLSFTENAGRVHLQGEAHIDWLIEHDFRMRQLAADNRIELSRLFATNSSINHYIDRHFRNEDRQAKQALSAEITEIPWLQVDLSKFKKS